MPAVFALLLCSCSDTTLVFQIQDSVSGSAPWNATVVLENRLLQSFYQTDAGPGPQRFTHLAPGRATLQAAAPGYEPLSVPVMLHPGKNRLADPLRLEGREIPGLADFSAFETVTDGAIGVQLRPLDASRKAIVHHPCLDLWIGCAVWEETGGGPGSRSAARGAELYRGVLAWNWDSRPETLFHYSAHIAASDLQDSPALYRVIDYLVVVPDPALLPRAEIDAAMAAAWPFGGLVRGNPGRGAPEQPVAEVAKLLDGWNGKARAFLLTSWDVRARQS